MWGIEVRFVPIETETEQAIAKQWSGTDGADQQA
jgi:hypothetical protein